MAKFEFDFVIEVRIKFVEWSIVFTERVPMHKLMDDWTTQEQEAKGESV